MKVFFVTEREKRMAHVLGAFLWKGRRRYHNIVIGDSFPVNEWTASAVSLYNARASVIAPMHIYRVEKWWRHNKKHFSEIVYFWIVLNDLHKKGSHKKWVFSAPNSWDMGFEVQIAPY